jgi:hypothetical protein
MALGVAAVAAASPLRAAPLVIDPGDTRLFTLSLSSAFVDVPGDTTGPDVVSLAGVPIAPPVIETELVQLQLTGVSPIVVPPALPIGNVTLFQGAATPGNPPADTVVRRTSPLSLANPGDSGTIQIELVEMHLQGLQPLILNGSTPIGNFAVDSFFDVFFDIDPSSGSLAGSLNVLRTGETTASFSGGVLGPARLRLHDQATSTDSFFDVFVELRIDGSLETATAVPAPGSGAAVIAWTLWLALWRRKALKERRTS